MKRPKSIKELFAIIELDREIDRYHALQDWVDSWIEDVEAVQHVTARKYLTSEYEDILKAKLAETLALDLCESGINFDLNSKKIKANLSILRRKARD